MSWLFQPLLPASADLQASASGSLDVLATRDALTLAEHVATVGLSKNVAGSTDALVLAEHSATVGVGGTLNVQASRDSLTLVEHKATVVGGSAPVVLSKAGGYEWHESDYKLRARLRKLALRQAHFEDEEETLAILLASLMRG